MRNYFTFGGIDSRTYGVYISGSGIFDSPERQYEMIRVPGRDGELIGIEKRMNNITLTYPAFIYSDFKNNMALMKAAFLSKIGYQRLTDSYYTDEFRKAAFAGDIKVKPFVQTAGQFDITFTCKPQRYLLTGESVTTITANSSTITNPTAFPSQPKIVVTGYGVFYIGSQKITVDNVYASVTIDSEMGDCYSGINNANAVVTFQDNNFPVIESGSVGITKDATITKLEITPRWWRV